MHLDVIIVDYWYWFIVSWLQNPNYVNRYYWNLTTSGHNTIKTSWFCIDASFFLNVTWCTLTTFEFVHNLYLWCCVSTWKHWYFHSSKGSKYYKWWILTPTMHHALLTVLSSLQRHAAAQSEHESQQRKVSSLTNAGFICLWLQRW